MATCYRCLAAYAAGCCVVGGDVYAAKLDKAHVYGEQCDDSSTNCIGIVFSVGVMRQPVSAIYEKAN
jgi:hypothetical protein